ncbi:sensor histidine kinase [Candidatus Magnetobacterium casense]|uniref:histidine kinase n=1 Tax=Candidatus Magnetobacterium casense TaxID=1455061 RepID=A0ABS6RXZ3_9BACT|nr:HAMP domain-containing sensor histidine kinase [Candidatus Magnetobacterium casensis]MBV6341504.1 HAMP domain-containing protein [Candidatus Magnetobacterium casensis]
MMLRKLSFTPSLNVKLIAMMLSLMAIIITLLVLFNYQLEQSLLMKIERQTDELTKAIQIGVEEVTGSGVTDEARLSKYLQKLNKKGLKEITIISNDSEVLASTNISKVGARISHRKKELVIKAELGEHVTDEGRAYNVIIPVIADGVQYGYIHLQINKDDFSDLIKANTIKRTILTLVVFGIGMGIVIIFSRRYTDPIKRLADASLRVSAGDLTQSIPVLSRDEIGKLSESFNYMVQRLRESRSIEERLREAEHLSGLGQLSRNIAHEIRNPLNFINLSIGYIEDKYRPAETESVAKFTSLISGIKHEVQRLNQLVTDFLEYSRPLKFSIQKVRVNPMLEDVLALVWAKAEADGIQIIREFDHCDVTVEVDPALFKSCILNVIVNAFNAMSESRKDGNALRLTSDLSDNDYLLTITDNGVGLSQELISKVFEPFFSTKPNHPGLGLPMTRRVMEELGGRVEFHSVEGEGCSVKLFLPCPCE